MEKYQLSPYIRMITDTQTGAAMVYHVLYGNPRIMNTEALQFLGLFRSPMNAHEAQISCEGDVKSIIDELVNINFLVEPGFDERAFLLEQRQRLLTKVQKGQTVDRMGLAISDACNFGCGHCMHFQLSGSDGTILSEYQRPTGLLYMSKETARKCIDRYVAIMRKRNQQRCSLHFGNAEPLLNWSVVEDALQYCMRINDVVFEFAINTNLILMTKGIAETLKQYHVRIATSLDGTEVANDAIRVTKGGHGTFRQIIEKFDLLAGIGYPLDGFSITVTKDNFNLIGTDVIDLAIQYGMTSIAFDYDLIGVVDVPVVDRVEKLMALKRYANKRGIDFFGTWDSVFRNLTTASLLTSTHAFCAAVEGKSIEFNVDGSIKICSHTTSRIGHVDTIDAAFDKGGGLFKTVQERFPGVDGYCAGCAIEGPCGGQCHVTREVAERAEPDQKRRLFADMCDFYLQITTALALDYIRTNGAAVVKPKPYTV